MLCIFLHGVCLEFVFFSFLLIWCSLHVLDWCNWNIQHPISNQHFATESSDSKNRTARYSHNAMIYLSLEIPCFVSLFFFFVLVLFYFAAIGKFKGFSHPPVPRSLMCAKAIKNFLAPYCLLPLANTCFIHMVM